MKKIIILGLSVLFCLSCNNHKEPTLEEKTLSTLVEQSKESINFEYSDIDATLLTIGASPQGFGGTSASVAYILLKNDSILIIAPQYVKPPFTKDEARLLIKSKMRRKMLLLD